MAKRFDPRLKDQLIAPERAARLNPKELLRSLGLRAGETLADIGCGPGFFALPAAEIVGARGKVFAVDVEPEMVDAVQQRARDAGLRNLEAQRVGEMDVALPPASADMILLAFVLHELTQRSLYLHRLRTVLREGGRLVILEWEPVATEFGPPVEDRLSADEVAADVQAAGFVVAERRSIAAEYFAVIAAPMSSASQPSPRR